MTTTFNFVLFKKRLNLFLSKIEALGGTSKLYEYPYNRTTTAFYGERRTRGEY